MLCAVVRQVCFPRPPDNFDLSLCLAVTQPVKSHVHGLCAFWLNFIIDYSLCCRVVGLDWGAWLWMPHFLEYLAEVGGFL
jgi:hypothetical protein